jgi:NAD(P)-dependent dehydrogenase (short-subunit alcohol dehydrogenase family)
MVQAMAAGADDARSRGDPLTPGAGPVAIVTGAGSGIGRSVAQLLSAAGWRLVLVGRRTGPLDETGASLGGPWIAAPADVGDEAQVRRVVNDTLRRLGRIDALVNNAGHAPMLPIEETTPEVIRGVFDVNAIGPAVAIAAVWPVFHRQGGGRIVNVSSYSTVDPFPGLFAYAGAKGALNLLAKAAANEGRSLGIKAFAVAPGAVETDMLRANFSESTLPTCKTLPPASVAQVIVECVTGERDDQNGEVILVPSP